MRDGIVSVLCTPFFFKEISDICNPKAAKYQIKQLYWEPNKLNEAINWVLKSLTREKHNVSTYFLKNE